MSDLIKLTTVSAMVGGMTGLALGLANAADNPVITFADTEGYSWSSFCQRGGSLVTEVGSNRFKSAGCPITLEAAVEDWGYMHRNHSISYSDRYTSRNMRNWVRDVQMSSLEAAKAHFESSGFTSTELNTDYSGFNEKGVTHSASASVSSIIAENENLPILQQREFGLFVVAGGTSLDVDYRGEIENPMPLYTGLNPFRQLGQSTVGYNNGDFIFEGNAELTLKQNYFIFDGAGNLLDERSVSASTTTDDIYYLMADPSFNSSDANTYEQDLEINKKGYTDRPSEHIEDNRYDVFKPAFVSLGEQLANQVPAVFDDLDRITQAAGLN